MSCKLKFYDPVVNYWKYSDSFSIKKNELKKFDVYVYLTKHSAFKNLNIKHKKKSLIFDLNHVLETKKRIKISKNKNYESYFIGSKKL